jgi:FkbM family methyltransferase
MKNFIQKIFNFFGYNVKKINASLKKQNWILRIGGSFIGWKQLESLPEIDTLIDIGVGPDGTEELYHCFKNAELILIDPLDEAKEYANKLSKNRKVIFFQSALGREDNIEKNMNIHRERGESSFLGVGPIFADGDYCTDIKKLKIQKLDTILNDKQKLGRIGIKIDVEGFELDVILGASETLKHTKFVIAEVRHCYESLKGVYKIHEFMNIMNKNNFTLSKILTAKSAIADLCFQSNNELF